MIVDAHGLSFVRLKKEDIELVRRWRNSKKINQHMHFKGHITPEMQNKWFESINNFSNYYFILQSGQSKIGLVNFHGIDSNLRNAETGIFIWDDNFLGSGIPVLSLLILLGFGYYFLGLSSVYGYVLRNNVRAINCYKKVGALLHEERDGDRVLMQATKEHYELKAQTAWKTILQDHNPVHAAKIVLEREDHESSLAQHITGVYNQLPPDAKARYALINKA